MFLPQTYLLALLMLVVSMVCWGSWANTLKLMPGYRFELFYWDFIGGLLAAVVIYAATFGSFGSTGNTVMADFSRASGFAYIMALLSGVVFNIGNLMLVASVEIAGMAVAFPVAVGLALIVGSVGSYMIAPKGNPFLLFTGIAMVGAAIVLDASAYRAMAAEDPLRADGSSSWKLGLLLSVVAGTLGGLFYPFYARATAGPAGLGPYAASVIFAAGAALCTIPLNGLYLMRKPIRGVPVTGREYFRTPASWHLLGLAGGLVWGTGTLFNFVAAAAGKVGPAVSYSLGQGATLVSAVWGVFVWREFAAARSGVVWRLACMFAAFLAGLLLVAIAPLY